jgi:peptide/nickel transport system permease protein
VTDTDGPSEDPEVRTDGAVERPVGPDETWAPPEYREEKTPERYTPLHRQVLRGIRNDKMALFGAVVVAVFVFMALFAPLIAPYGPDETTRMTVAPNGFAEGDFDDDGTAERVWHPLGTTSHGHDLLTRIIYGSRVSLMVAAATALFAFIIGTSIGLLAGFYGGWVDDLLMRYIDFQWAFPSLILAVAVITYVGGLGVWNVVVAIGVAYIDDFARIIRGEILSIREQPYITAARATGMRDIQIMVGEMLPNAVAPLLVQLTVMLPLAILAEAGLSFLGLGVKPTTPTWGLILSDGRQFISSAWWISVMPGIAIMLTVLGFNMLGDGLRDALDVKNEAEEGVTER